MTFKVRHLYDSERLDCILAEIRELRKEVHKLMATFDGFIADVTKFQSDVTNALARAQKSIDDLKNAPGGLTPQQQAALDAADAALQTADAAVQAFDVPPAPPAPTPAP